MKKRIIFFLSLFMIVAVSTIFNSCKEDEFLLIKEVVITWENPAELVIGLPLTETQLNATANVPGTFVFTPALGTVLQKGENQTLKADFTPTDSKYKSQSKTVTINIVDKYIPVITWANPAVLALGTPLSTDQLNATANVPGTFVYTPPLGTVLPLGDNQELKVDFTPSVNTHQPTSKTVKINVKDVVPIKFAGGAEWTGQKSLAFNVSGNVGKLGTNPANGFTVHVKNTYKDVDKDIAVTGVSLNPANAARIELALAEAVYGDDVITIAFNEVGSGIVSADEQPLKSFGAQRVTIPVNGPNLLAEKSTWAGFEGTGGANSAGAAGYWVGAALPWQRTTDKFVSGVASMKFTGGFDLLPLYGMDFGNNVDIQAGAYEVSHKIFIENGSALKKIRVAMARQSKGWVDDFVAYFDVENIKRGEWVTIKQIMSFPVAYNSSDKTRYTYYVEAGINPGVTGNQTFYLDDMGLVKVAAGARP